MKAEHRPGLQRVSFQYQLLAFRLLSIATSSSARHPARGKGCASAILVGGGFSGGRSRGASGDQFRGGLCTVPGDLRRTAGVGKEGRKRKI
jgi:hypothetical protein